MNYYLVFENQEKNISETITLGKKYMKLNELDQFTSKFVNQESLLTYLYKNKMIPSTQGNISILGDGQTVESHQVLYNHDNSNSIADLLRFDSYFDNEKIAKKVIDHFNQKLMSEEGFYQYVSEGKSSIDPKFLAYYGNDSVKDILTIDGGWVKEDYTLLRSIVSAENQYDQKVHQNAESIDHSHYYGIPTSSKVNVVMTAFSKVPKAMLTKKEDGSILVNPKYFNHDVDSYDEKCFQECLNGSVLKTLRDYIERRDVFNKRKRLGGISVSGVRETDVSVHRNTLERKISSPKQIDSAFLWANLFFRHHYTDNIMTKEVRELDAKKDKISNNSLFNPKSR